MSDLTFQLCCLVDESLKQSEEIKTIGKLVHCTHSYTCRLTNMNREVLGLITTE